MRRKLPSFFERKIRKVFFIGDIFLIQREEENHRSNSDEKKTE